MTLREHAVYALQNHPESGPPRRHLAADRAGQPSIFPATISAIPARDLTSRTCQDPIALLTGVDMGEDTE